jgi:hypothetical protein
MSDHLLTVHKTRAKARRPYEEYAATFDSAGPDEVKNPKDGGPPIPELKLHSGYSCRVCCYITTGKVQIGIHANQKHRWVKQQGPQWDVKLVQTFFTNNKTRYFIVASPPETPQSPKPAGNVDSMIQALLDRQEQQEREEDRERGKVEEDQVKSDNTPWLRRNGWLRKFAGKGLGLGLGSL